MKIMEPNPRILVLTLCIGADYRRKLQDCLASKEAYCKKHGYTYVLAGEEFWDRERPIPWSKIGFYSKYIREAMETGKYDYIWCSDADVYITNLETRIEDVIKDLFPSNKDLLMTMENIEIMTLLYGCKTLLKVVVIKICFYGNYLVDIL